MIAVVLAGGVAAATWPALTAAAEGAEKDAAPDGAEKDAAAEGAEKDAAPEQKGGGWGWGNEDELKEAREAARRVVQPRTARIFAKARQHLLAEDYEQAQKVIDKVQPGRANPYERAQAARIRAYIAHGRGDPEAATALLREALSEDALSRADRADVLFQLAQLEGSLGKWSESVATLKEWFATAERAGSAAYFLLGLAYYQLKDLDAALEPARKAVELSDTPQQSWLQLLLTIHLSKQDYAAATPVLLDLLSRNPGAGKNYWLQLSTLYGVQGDVPRALAVLELVRRQGLMSEDRDLRRLAQISLSQGMPIRAAELVETAIDQQAIQPDAEAYELVANSWILARQAPKARPALERAADLSPTGELYVRLGQLFMLEEDWEAAVQALQKAMAKGGLDDPSQAALLLGIAHFSADHVAEARVWFARARRSEKSRDAATSWLQYIDSELRERRARGAAVG